MQNSSGAYLDPFHTTILLVFWLVFLLGIWREFWRLLHLVTKTKKYRAKTSGNRGQIRLLFPLVFSWSFVSHPQHYTRPTTQQQHTLQQSNHPLIITTTIIASSIYLLLLLEHHGSLSTTCAYGLRCRISRRSTTSTHAAVAAKHNKTCARWLIDVLKREKHNRRRHKEACGNGDSFIQGQYLHEYALLSLPSNATINQI